MRKLFFPLCFSAFNVFIVYGQTDTTVLTGEAAKSILNQIGFDSTTFLKQASKDACLCIDSVDNAEKVKSKKIEAFSGCIDKEVDAYQLAVKLLNSMKGSTKDNKISIANKNSNEYKHYYYDIERWLLDSCAALKRAIASNDVEREKSFSDNAEAMAEYNKGVALLKKEKYEDCIPFFEKAVSIDPEFSFAWDNLGICYRRTNKLDKAVTAYKASLKVDPAGKTPLQNLAVVYMLQNKDDDAINTYNEILKYYSDDVEVYYGISMVYLNNKKDMENALQNMCKAYNIYIKLKSPYRSDAEKVINMIYAEMKKAGKEEKFQSILKENNIKSN
jgi:tetratricopeptide (TPR) repeat protein